MVFLIKFSLCFAYLVVPAWPVRTAKYSYPVIKTISLLFILSILLLLLNILLLHPRSHKFYRKSYLTGWERWPTTHQQTLSSHNVELHWCVSPPLCSCSLFLCRLHEMALGRVRRTLICRVPVRGDAHIMPVYAVNYRLWDSRHFYTCHSRWFVGIWCLHLVLQSSCWSARSSLDHVISAKIWFFKKVHVSGGLCSNFLPLVFLENWWPLPCCSHTRIKWGWCW